LAEPIESEAELIKKAREGGIKAFESLISKYQKTIYNIAYQFVQNQEDANDLSQDAFVKAFQSIKKFRGDCSFSTWLYRIVKNVFLDECRSSSGKMRALESPLQEEGGNLQAPAQLHHADDQLKSMEKKDLQEMVQRAIRELPLKFQLPIILYDIQNFSYQEISEITNASVGTVKSRLNRARKLLRKIILKKRELF